MSGRVFLYLLDSPQGHPVQYWTMDGQSLVRIGRAVDNDVVIPHPCVSRAHAYISRWENEWRLTSLSPQGIMHHSENVKDLLLSEGDEFRLGPAGPAIRFASSRAPELSGGQTTLGNFSGALLPLMLDSTRLTREVEAIVADPYFQKLQAMTRKLRSSL